MEAWLIAWLQFLVLLPAALSCFLVMKHQLRYSPLRTAAVCAAVLLPLTVLGAWACAAAHIVDINALLLPMLAVLFFGYRAMLRCRISKCLAVFIGVCAVQTFPAQFAVAFDAATHPEVTTNSTSLEGAVFQLVLSAALTGAFVWPEVRALYKMVDDIDIAGIWYAAAAISAAFLGSNILALPRFYTTLRTARLPYLFPILEGVALCVLLSIYGFFLYGASVINENARLRSQAQLLEMQARQYQMLQDYVERTSRLRHDFRHSVRLLTSLAEEGDLPSIRAYLAESSSRLTDSPPRTYCSNAALNALFVYYHAEAEAAGIRTDWRLQLPDPLPFSEIDLASLFGNLIENAIEGCATVPEDTRYFSLLSEVRHEARLYIVSTNSFDGHTNDEDGTFRSTKHEGCGFGLASIEALTQKCGGSMRAAASGSEFYVDIVLQI